MKRWLLFSLILCTILLCCAGCAKEPAPFDSAAAAAPASTFPLIRLGKLSLTAPEGFTAGDDGKSWYAPKYPSDGSCITLHTADTIPPFASYTADKVKQALESSYKDTLGTAVTVTMDAFTFTAVSGFDALRLQYHFTYRDIKINCLQYLIGADKSYTVTCMQVANAKWMTQYDTVCTDLYFTWELLMPLAA